MPSLPPLALAVLVGASSAAWAVEQSAIEPSDLVVPPVVELLDLPVDAAPGAPGPATPESMLKERKRDAPPDGLERSPGEPGVSPFKVRLGRTPVAGRSPGDAPPLYGEVGIDVDSGTGLSLVPSFRVVLPNDDETAASEAAATQILKLGAKIRF
ncbi:MAG: hypothetical protein ACREIR_22865 [Geminicoccaceae bacterium]